MQISDLSDSDEIYSLQKRLTEITERMSALVPAVGKARQVREFSSDRRKRTLAKAMTTYLDQGESAASADAKARASYLYSEEMIAHEKALQASEIALADWDALHCAFEATRTLISVNKEMVRMQ
jgi:hypothetical protein